MNIPPTTAGSIECSSSMDDTTIRAPRQFRAFSNRPEKAAISIGYFMRPGTWSHRSRLPTELDPDEVSSFQPRRFDATFDSPAGHRVLL